MQWEHNGHTITLTDDKRFMINGGLFDGDAGHLRISDSYSEATHKIDDRAALEAKKNRQSNRLTLAALDSNGRSITITGIHIKHGTLLGFDNAGEAYPAVAWLRELLVEHKACRDRIEQIGRLTYKFRIGGRRAYSIKPEDYDRLIAKLVEEHRIQTEAAEAHRPAAE